MSLDIQWQQPVLTLAGTLDRNTVPALWKRRGSWDGLKTISVEALDKVDTAGLAILLALTERYPAAQVRGASERLKKLAELGDLDAILPIEQA
ncbi:STAS domain-containing protein [Gallaecimonas pentaromativorans]|uniref:Phospholipid transport system transporter-binding protein n=1 Tax=Gallaecimonas pentaromativorans TaxID=584787 RepID=A0A3N1PRY8_9GAMM|nr:STAS domain-containing protein [Gallaecimonas pentaromativorans]MED5523608.1 STAS domain-containing protein [Pseudomonadota bacterium]ROQ30798.1 phospholipid transport system transporter-binding protein [Gallaecimonas pentaromativorans]